MPREGSGQPAAARIAQLPRVPVPSQSASGSAPANAFRHPGTHHSGDVSWERRAGQVLKPARRLAEGACRGAALDRKQVTRADRATGVGEQSHPERHRAGFPVAVAVLERQEKLTEAPTPNASWSQCEAPVMRAPSRYSRAAVKPPRAQPGLAVNPPRRCSGGAGAMGNQGPESGRAPRRRARAHYSNGARRRERTDTGAKRTSEFRDRRQRPADCVAGAPSIGLTPGAAATNWHYSSAETTGSTRQPTSGGVDGLSGRRGKQGRELPLHMGRYRRRLMAVKSVLLT